MAKREHTTPTPIQVVTPVTPGAEDTTLPSIASLGRRLAALDAEYHRLDQCPQVGAEYNRMLSAQRVIMAQRDALQALISTIPAVTVEDAAVQIATATHLVDDLTCKDFREYETDQASQAMDRLLLSALPVMAAAAGLDMDAMRWEDLARLRTTLFAGVEAVR